MAGKPRIKIAITGDSKDLSQAVDKAEGKLKGFSSKLKGVGKIAGPLAALGAGAAAFSFLKEGTLDAQAMNSALANTESILKTTGGASGKTAAELAKVADKMEMKIGVNETEILEAQNVLLTFTNVAGQEFDKATGLAFDMSAVLGGDAKSASMQLGKALNDPIKGMTSLSRAGVTFTDEQKAQVKAMQEAGDMQGAQGVILKELEKQFGGTAEASADSTAKIGLMFGELREKVGGHIIGLIDKAMPYIQQFGEEMMPKIGDAMRRVGEVVGPIVEQIVAWFRDNWPTISAAVSSFGQTMGDVFTKIGEIVRAVWPVVQELISVALAKIIELVQTYGPQIKEMFSSIFETVKVVVETVVRVVRNLWERFGSHLVEKLQTAWNNIQQVLEGAIAIVTGIFDFIKAVLTGKWGDAWDAIKKILKGAWDIIVGLVKGAINVVSGIIGGVMAGISAAWGYVWGGIKSIAGGIWDWLKDKIGGAIGWVRDKISERVEAIKKLWSLAWSAVKTAASNIWDGIKNTISNAIDNIRNIINNVKGTFSGIFDGIANGAKSAFNLVANAWNNTVGRLSWTVPTWIPGIGGNTISAPQLPTFSTGTTQRYVSTSNPTYHTGDVVPGRGEKDVTVLGGEGIFTPAQMKALAPVDQTPARSGRPIVVQMVTPDGRVMAEQVLPGIVAIEKARR